MKKTMKKLKNAVFEFIILCGIEYVCTMDGYVFTEDELMALEDYKNSL